MDSRVLKNEVKGPINNYPLAILRNAVSRIFESQGLLIAVLVFGIIMSFSSEKFLTPVNITNIMYQSTIFAILAMGQMFVILVRGIDLSVGSLIALTSVISVGIPLKNGGAAWEGIAVALLIGLAFGLVHGLAVTKLRMPALIVTLASLSLAKGLAFVYSEGVNIAPIPAVYKTWGNAQVFGGKVPIFIVFTVIIAIASHFVLKKTRFGRMVYAVGGNEVASRLAGIPTTRIIVTAFMISGLSAAIAGMMMTARLQSGNPSMGSGMELTVIAAVVIGGTSLFGGQGNVLGTILGVLLLSMVSNAIVLLQVPPNYDDVFTGLVIAFAASIDIYRRKFTQIKMNRLQRHMSSDQAGAEAVKAVYSELQMEKKVL